MSSQRHPMVSQVQKIALTVRLIQCSASFVCYYPWLQGECRGLHPKWSPHHRVVQGCTSGLETKHAERCLSMTEWTRAPNE